MIPAGPIPRALHEIQYSIPREITSIAFSDELNNCTHTNLSLEELINVNIIQGRVLLDCDIVGGVEVNIDITNIQPIFADQDSRVYCIPKDRSRGRSIVSVLSLAPRYLDGSAGAYQNNVYNSNPLLNVALKGMDAATGQSPFFSAKLSLIGENTILVRYNNFAQEPGFIRCLIQNDEDLLNISPRSYNHFSRLVVLATKSYIYKELFIKIDKAFLQGGQELGSMKEYIDSYSDAEEEYQTYLREVWQRVSIMNDDEQYNRLIKISINPF